MHFFTPTIIVETILALPRRFGYFPVGDIP